MAKGINVDHYASMSKNGKARVRRARHGLVSGYNDERLEPRMKIRLLKQYRKLASHSRSCKFLNSGTLVLHERSSLSIQLESF